MRTFGRCDVLPSIANKAIEKFLKRICQAVKILEYEQKPGAAEILERRVERHVGKQQDLVPQVPGSRSCS